MKAPMRMLIINDLASPDLPPIPRRNLPPLYDYGPRPLPKYDIPPLRKRDLRPLRVPKRDLAKAWAERKALARMARNKLLWKFVPYVGWIATAYDLYDEYQYWHRPGSPARYAMSESGWTLCNVCGTEPLAFGRGPTVTNTHPSNPNPGPCWANAQCGTNNQVWDFVYGAPLSYTVPAGTGWYQMIYRFGPSRLSGSRMMFQEVWGKVTLRISGVPQPATVPFLPEVQPSAGWIPATPFRPALQTDKGYGPREKPDPEIEGHVMPVPGRALRPYEAPAYQWAYQPNVNKNAGRFPPIVRHKNQKPPPGTKERKRTVPVPKGLGGAAAFMGAASEMKDLAEALWWALPANKRTPYASPFQMAKDIWDGLDDIDWGQAVENVIVQHYTDKAIGKANNAASKAVRNHPYWKSPVGPGTGGAAQRWNTNIGNLL